MFYECAQIILIWICVHLRLFLCLLACLAQKKRVYSKILLKKKKSIRKN